MRILHVTEAYGGGVFTSVNQLVTGQYRAGHEVWLAASPRPEAPANWRDLLPAGIGVVPLNLSRPIAPVKDTRAVWELYQLIKRLRPDAIHLHSSKAGFAGRLAARLAGVAHRTFYSPRAFAFLAPDLSPGKQKLYRNLELVAARVGGLVVACSRDELDVAQSLGIPSLLINNAIDISAIHDTIAGIDKTPSNSVRIMTSGRVCAAKRPQLFVAVAEELRRRGLPVTMTWIGGGEPFPLTAAAQCTGWASRAEVLRSLQANADIYLQTSSYEGMPLSVLEAQGLGLPVVVADAPGNRSAVAEGRSGFVVPAEVGALANRLEQLVLDTTLRKDMGCAARKWACAEFDTPLMLARYESLYTSGNERSRHG